VVEAEVGRERLVDAVILEHGVANCIIVLVCEGILLVPSPHPTPVSLHSGQDGPEFPRGFVASGGKPVATGAGLKATGASLLRPRKLHIVDSSSNPWIVFGQMTSRLKLTNYVRNSHACKVFEKYTPQVGTAAGDEDSVATGVNM
jgi:hypothetical protein